MTKIEDMSKEPGATSFGFSYSQGAQMIAEAEATLAELRSLLDKGRTDPRRVEVTVEILADLRRAFHPQPWTRCAHASLDARFHWRDKIAEVRFTIEERDRTWPGMVDKGRMHLADAQRRIAIYRGIHDAYWIHTMAWQTTSDAGHYYHAQIINREPRDEVAREWYYDELRHHLAAIAAEGRQEQQQLL